MTVLGGNATPVHILDATDLVENGGDYKVIGRVAQRVYGDDTREIIGDTLQPIYILQTSDLVENGGNFKVIGNQAIPLSKLLTTRKVKGKVAIAVYLENSDWIIPPIPPPTIIFYDTFTDSNGTLLENHTPDIDLSGLGWTVLPSGNYQIISNQFQKPLAGSRGCLAKAAANTNITYEITTPPTLLSVGFQFDFNPRLASFTSYWGWGIWSSGVGWDIQLVERSIVGGRVIRASSVSLLANNTTYAVTGSAIGNVHSFTINGVTLSYIDPGNYLLTEDDFGVWSNSVGFKMDNLRITT